MKPGNQTLKQSKQGSVMITTIIMLGIVGMTIGLLVAGLQTDAKLAQHNNYREKAILLADAGLRAGIWKMNAANDSTISYKQSQAYFANHAAFGDADWGFVTETRILEGSNIVLVSTGIYQDKQQEVQASMKLGSGSRSVHALYSHALYAGNSSGNSSYTLEIGGMGSYVIEDGSTGSYVDFVKGDVYSGGHLSVSGYTKLRLPEIINEVIYDDIYDPFTETYQDAFAVAFFSNGLTQAAYDAYVSSVSDYSGTFYNNGVYDYGEAYVDDEGNGRYDLGESFYDANGNGVRDAGDGYVDNNNNEIYDAGIDTIIDNGNGMWDAGEEWVDNTGGKHNKRRNGRYDPAGGFYNRNGNWTTRYWKRGRLKYCSSWPAEDFEDTGNNSFEPGEPWVDDNGIWDEGEEYLDDRNGEYDYGTQAYGTIWGMPSPGPGQRASTGGDSLISPPDLEHMFYHVSKDDYQPSGALTRWGHDVAVTASDYYSNGKLITDSSKPEHIFTRNIRRSPSGQGNGYYRDTISGVTVRSREYDYVYDDNGNRVDDYFLEDPTDYYYTRTDGNNSIDGTSYTSPSYINVKPEHNSKLYYVEGNVYLHASPTYCMMFKQPGTRITIVAKGNITISDEFYYNADYDSNLDRSNVDSTIVKNPSDALCLIALKNDDCSNSGNIFIGDAAHGTGGSIHAMLYAENDFVDNNLNTRGQPFISIFGNMSAGNHIQLNRPSSGSRTRLDVTLDERIRDGEIIIPGLPHSIGSGERSIQIDTEWTMLPGTWESWSMIK